MDSGREGCSEVGRDKERALNPNTSEGTPGPASLLSSQVSVPLTASSSNQWVPLSLQPHVGLRILVTRNGSHCPPSYPWLPTGYLQKAEQKHVALPDVKQVGMSLGTRPGKQLLWLQAQETTTPAPHTWCQGPRDSL